MIVWILVETSVWVARISSTTWTTVLPLEIKVWVAMLERLAKLSIVKKKMLFGLYYYISNYAYFMWPAGVAETQAARATTAEMVSNFIFILVYYIGARMGKCIAKRSNDGDIIFQTNKPIYMTFYILTKNAFLRIYGE